MLPRTCHVLETTYTSEKNCTRWEKLRHYYLEANILCRRLGSRWRAVHRSDSLMHQADETFTLSHYLQMFSDTDVTIWKATLSTKASFVLSSARQSATIWAELSANTYSEYCRHSMQERPCFQKWYTFRFYQRIENGRHRGEGWTLKVHENLPRILPQTVDFFTVHGSAGFDDDFKNFQNRSRTLSHDDDGIFLVLVGRAADHIVNQESAFI